jgi:PIN domain nuclease of toxin-antitoxin system
MRLLLDTHTLLWWMTEDKHLSPMASSLIGEIGNQPLVSSVSAWEIATKFRLGRLPAAANLVNNFVSEMSSERFQILSMTADHGLRAGLLPGLHKDPFDRMLIAQALIEEVPIVSNDLAFDQFGVQRLW